MVEDTQLEDATITTNGGEPAVELPNGERLTLGLFVDLPNRHVLEGDDIRTTVETGGHSWWIANAQGEDVCVTIEPRIGHHDHDA